jgi:hypothetical protein
MRIRAEVAGRKHGRSWAAREWLREKERDRGLTESEKEMLDFFEKRLNQEAPNTFRGHQGETISEYWHKNGVRPERRRGVSGDTVLLVVCRIFRCNPENLWPAYSGIMPPKLAFDDMRDLTRPFSVYVQMASPLERKRFPSHFHGTNLSTPWVPSFLDPRQWLHVARGTVRRRFLHLGPELRGNNDLKTWLFTLPHIFRRFVESYFIARLLKRS